MSFFRRCKRLLMSTDECNHDYRKWRVPGGYKYVCQECYDSETHYATVADQIAAEGIEAITP